VEAVRKPVLIVDTWPVVVAVRSMIAIPPLPSAVASVVGFSSLRPSGP